MSRLTFALLLLLLPGRLLAQGWELQAGDDGAFFLGRIALSGVSGFEVLCGGRSAQGLSPEATGNLEPETTAPGTFRILLGEGVIGPAAAPEAPRADVILVTGATGFRLRGVRHNALLGAWEADLADTDPVFSALASSPRIELHSRAGRRVFPGAGFDSAIKRLGDYCRSMFAAIGQPWHGAPSPGQGTRAAAEAALTAGCNGPATREPGYLLTGNLDGDGAEDTLLDWARILCDSGVPRPFCGAALCTVDVFLSSRAGLPPDSLLTGSVTLVPLTNGNQGLATYGPSPACGDATRNCQGLYYWDGAGLTRLE